MKVLKAELGLYSRLSCGGTQSRVVIVLKVELEGTQGLKCNALDVEPKCTKC